MYMAWLNDLDPQPPYLFICWVRGADWSDTVDSWSLPGLYSIDTAETCLTEHGWRRLSDWHPIEFGHVAIVDQTRGGDDDHGNLSTRERVAGLSLSAAR